MSGQENREVPSALTYVGVWLALLVLLAMTLGSAYVHLGLGNAIANVGIAAAKMLLVMFFFMHLRSSGGLLKLLAVTGFIWLGLLVSLTLADVVTRHIPPVPADLAVTGPVERHGNVTGKGDAEPDRQ